MFLSILPGSSQSSKILVMSEDFPISADLGEHLLETPINIYIFGVEKRCVLQMLSPIRFAAEITEILKDSKATELEVLKDDQQKVALSFLEMSETRPRCWHPLELENTINKYIYIHIQYISPLLAIISLYIHI